MVSVRMQPNYRAVSHFALEYEQKGNAMSTQKSTCEHSNFMSQALHLAKRGRYTVSPNPMVGCLIVKNGQILGQGYHQRAGGPHAEIYALKEAGKAAHGATAYVTLEPCCHFGKTPPCTSALIEAGISKVYVATQDPYTLVAGKGIQALQAAGIEVEIGLLRQEAQSLNEIFFHYITRQRPFVIAKWAMSLDGKTITHADDNRDISSPESQQTAHDIRQQVDAILIGAKTACYDNPQLTARFTTENTSVTKQPIRIVLTTHGNLPMDLKIFDPLMPAKTIIATTGDADKSWCQLMTNKNMEILILPKNERGQVDLPSLLDALGKREITSLLVEGGMTVHESFFNEHLVNKVQVYLAPVIIGSLPAKKPLKILNISHLARDIHLTADYEDTSYV